MHVVSDRGQKRKRDSEASTALEFHPHALSCAEGHVQGYSAASARAGYDLYASFLLNRLGTWTGASALFGSDRKKWESAQLVAKGAVVSSLAMAVNLT